MFAYIPGNGSDRSLFLRLSGYLQQEDSDAFLETVTAIFASIPYSLESERDEAYFHIAFFLMVSASGVNACSEMLNCNGRIDLVMEFTDKIYIIEFKCNQSAEAGIKQIREKGYDDKFKQSGKKIIPDYNGFGGERSPAESVIIKPYFIVLNLSSKNTDLSLYIITLFLCDVSCFITDCCVK